MTKLLIGGALALSVVSLTACGGSSTISTNAQAVQRQADLYAIEQLEVKFHKATSRHDIDLMMSLWAPNATFTVGAGQTVTGKEEIKRFFLSQSVAFQPENNWVSDTVAYKIRSTANGDRGTLYFECHYIDRKTRKLVVLTAADQQVARIDGRWLITNMVGASPTLTP
jgi:aspartate carbamoyltransferase regulatory subunit